ncbi:dihydrodipicolinate synthase family protein [Arhodomonas sp. AD133]|uniref:dihydrodipicolinate synthase family protein n=1 Tax=Arhodomonas sp. AD133 TaxID=3415009 RepID=UPI003EB7378B
MQVDWRGIYPAATTQMKPDGALDIEANQRMVEQMIADGVHGLVMLGSVGENTSLTAEEKRRIIASTVEVAGGRVPVISGVAEYTTDLAVDYARDCERLGADGLMVLPAMVYKADVREVVTHIRTTAEAVDLPVQIYNNPGVYGIDIEPPALVELARGTDNIVSVKESSEDPRRITDIINQDPQALALMSGVDDVALECMVLGCQGWVSGFANVFPAETVAIYDHWQAGRLDKAIEIYRWMMPALHMDVHPKLVQMIKLAEQVAGRGSETVRAPRLTLEGDQRAYVIDTIERALANRPSLD